MKKYGIAFAIIVVIGLAFWANSVGVFKKTSITKNTISYSGQEGKTALELLKLSYTVETKNSGGIEQVVSINGKRISEKEYWAFMVNGIQQPSSAASYITKNTEVISWEVKAVNTSL